MEEFIFVEPSGEVFREEVISVKYRHGDIAYKYMKDRNLEIKDVDINEKNGYQWGLELAHYHSRLVIQDGDSIGIVYIPSKLTDEQKEWSKKSLMNELELMDGQIFICDYVDNEMIRYNYSDSDIMKQLITCLKQKGVDILVKEEKSNGIQK